MHAHRTHLIRAQALLRQPPSLIMTLNSPPMTGAQVSSSTCTVSRGCMHIFYSTFHAYVVLTSQHFVVCIAHSCCLCMLVLHVTHTVLRLFSTEHMIVLSALCMLHVTSLPSTERRDSLVHVDSSITASLSHALLDDGRH